MTNLLYGILPLLLRLCIKRKTRKRKGMKRGRSLSKKGVKDGGNDKSIVHENYSGELHRFILRMVFPTVLMKKRQGS